MFGGGGALHCNFPFVTSANLFERGGGGGGAQELCFCRPKRTTRIHHLFPTLALSVPMNMFDPRPVERQQADPYVATE